MKLLEKIVIQQTTSIIKSYVVDEEFSDAKKESKRHEKFDIRILLRSLVRYLIFIITFGASVITTYEFFFYKLKVFESSFFIYYNWDNKNQIYITPNHPLYFIFNHYSLRKKIDDAIDKNGSVSADIIYEINDQFGDEFRQDRICKNYSLKETIEWYIILRLLSPKQS